MTSAMDKIFEPPETKAGRNRRRLKRIGFATAVIMLAASTAFVIGEVISSCGQRGVYLIDGECVGVTDGSYLFHPEFEDIQKKIAAENAEVRKNSSYVTVALLNPLTATETSALSKDEILKQLEGAYTAQYRINHRTAVGELPKIQLVLANEGSTSNQWRPVVEQLVEMTRQKNPLVAVVGMGISICQTEEAARELSRHRIPMVGAIITADGLEHSNIDGLIRVSPSNRDYTEILGLHLYNETKLRSAMLVYDTNSDTNCDLFTKTLREALEEKGDDTEKKVGDLIKFPLKAYTGGRLDENADASRFTDIIPNICAMTGTPENLDVILYAGRRNDLPGFLEALQNRICRDSPITVVAPGINPAVVLLDREGKLMDTKITVISLERTYSRGWDMKKTGTPERYQDFQREFTGLKFNPEHLADDRVMMMHDALLTAAKAVQLATAGASGRPTAAEVLGQLMNLHGVHRVPGASGTLSFSYRKPGAGNPQGKPMLVLQFPSSTPGVSEQVGPVYSTPCATSPTEKC